jgi:phenylalanine-4-hydroxylase
MTTIDYDITKYQPVLYCAASLDHLEDTVGRFFAETDDDTPARLKSAAAATR